MTRESMTLALVTRLHDLADTLVVNARVLAENTDLPEALTQPRSAVYADVATQARLLADAEQARVEAAALVAVRTEVETAERVARELERLAGLLTRNAATLIRFTADAAMTLRARVYRDVAGQVRVLAQDERASHVRPVRRLAAVPVSGPSPLAVQAAARVPEVRPAFMEPLVDAIAKRHRAGWSTERLTLWLHTTLRDPQIGEALAPANGTFVAYVTGLLPAPRRTTARRIALAA